MSELGTVPIISFENPAHSSLEVYDEEPPADAWAAYTAILIPVLRKSYKTGDARYKVKMKSLRGEGRTREEAETNLRSKIRSEFDSLRSAEAKEIGA